MERKKDSRKHAISSSITNSINTSTSNVSVSTPLIRKAPHGSPARTAAGCRLAASRYSNRKATKLSVAEKRAGRFRRKAKLVVTIIGMLFLAFMSESQAAGEIVLRKGKTIAASSLSSLPTLASIIDDITAKATSAGPSSDPRMYQFSSQGPNEVSDDPFWNSTLLLLDQKDNETEILSQLSSNMSSNPTNKTDEWEGLYDVPLYMIVGLSLCYGAISFCAVVGNALVLWVVIVSNHFLIFFYFLRKLISSIEALYHTSLLIYIGQHENTHTNTRTLLIKQKMNISSS